MPDFGRLDQYLEDMELEGYLLDASGEVSDQRYLAGFDAPDPFFTVYTPERISLLVPGLEYGRAQSESRADVVRRFGDYDFEDLRAEQGEVEARREMVASFLEEVGVNAVAVPRRFPVDTADGLREQAVHVAPDPNDVVTSVRAVKSSKEIEHIKRTQRANEAAMRAAVDLLTSASIEGDELLLDGEVLTAERIKREIALTLVRHDCGVDRTIVAGGAQGADPHQRGSGPLPPHQPIVIDIFPHDEASNYHADMTRTLVRGEPSQAQQDRHAVTVEALEAALAAIEPGTTGQAVHEAACEVYEEAGFATLRSDPDTEVGFIHSTGHGVGLDLHERPRLAPSGEALEPGHVVTVEPGLYDPAVGGMRVEDLVVVTEEGYESLTSFPKDLAV